MHFSVTSSPTLATVIPDAWILGGSVEFLFFISVFVLFKFSFICCMYLKKMLVPRLNLYFEGP